MSDNLRVDKQLLKVEKVIGEDTVREVVEAQIQLPFKVIKVFDVIANVIDVQAEVRQDAVLVTGVIDKQLFVVDKGDLIRHIPEQVSFQALVRVQGARPDMKVQVQVRIIRVDTELIQPDVIRQVIVLEIFVKVTVTEQIFVVIDVRNKNIIVKKELLKVDSVVGEDTIRQVISPEVTLPITAKKIFRILPTVRNVTADIQNGVVIVRGVIHKQIFLVDEGNLLRHAAEDVPFTKTIPIPGAKPDQQVQVDIRVKLNDFELIDPPSRRLVQTLMIEAFVKVTETLQLEVVKDVKGPGIEVEKKLLKVESVVVDVVQQETIQATVKLPVQAIKIFEILAQIVDLQAEAQFDAVIVKGVLHKQIFFVDPSNLIRHTREDIPFRFIKDAPGARPGMNVQVRASIIGDIIHRIVDNQGLKVEQKAVIEIFAKVTETVQQEVVIDVRRKIPPKHPSY